MKKTKIICSIGPASNQPDVMEQMVNNGMNIARLNFSHATDEEKMQFQNCVREVRKRTGKNISILWDTKGPELRGCVMEENDEGTEGAQLIVGNTIRLVKEAVIGNAERITFNHPSVINTLEVNDEVWLENAKMKVVVTSVEEDGVTCQITQGGFLGSRKSCIIPGKPLNIPYVSNKDREDIKYSCEHGGEYLAISFVSNKENIFEIKELLKEYGREDLKIICKVESLYGVQNIKEIYENSDGVMIGRGDLGSEVPPEEIPAIQKMMIKVGREMGKIVIVATEMLETMMENNRPKRAETSDIANAVFDGTDAVMLSGETTIGKHPIETVGAMARTCEVSEKYADFDGKFKLPVNDDKDCVALASGVINCANIVNAKMIVVQSHTGKTARILSNLKPKAPILVICDEEKLGRRLGLNYGVYSVVSNRESSIDKFIIEAKKCAIDFAKNNGIELNSGDKILITAGFVGSDESSRKYVDSNLMKIDTI
ncbi:MAG: pyruvate kinase [Bacilli bacterium]|nr:pyruvate kinase [Bacilli bacterium]